MAKPTPDSVTEVPCTCGSLQRGADDPRSPIVFDAEMNEYHFEYSTPCSDGQCEPGKAHMMIYHCPFCGGAAPTSKRDLMFAVIPLEEERRLNQLVSGIKSIDDAFRTLGSPDLDLPHGITVQKDESDGSAPTFESFRMLTYSRLSETAEVQIIDYRKDGVHVVLLGKYIGLVQGEDSE